MKWVCFWLGVAEEFIQAIEHATRNGMEDAAGSGDKRNINKWQKFQFDGEMR